MRGMKPRCGVRSPRTVSSSTCLHRAPLTLLWLALLTVAAGPAACFVTPSSVRAASFFAAAHSVPRLIREPKNLVACSGAHDSSVNSISSGRRKSSSARVRGRREGSDEHHDPGDSDDLDEAGEQLGVANAYPGGTTSIGTGYARGFRAVKALTAGKGLRAAATTLRAATTGDGLGSSLTQRKPGPKRILILMSDTGGGHRASSQALAAAIKKLYGDQIHTDIVDIWTLYGRFPFSDAVRTYKFLGRHPVLWKLSYDFARFPPTRRWSEILANITCHRSFRRCLDEYQPDLVVAAHPLCHHVPHRVLKRLRRDTGKEIPLVTVVTDLGSAHPTWFDPRDDLVYVPSDVLRRRAQTRGIAPHKLMQFGLPVRAAFLENPDKQEVQRKLGLKEGVRTALIVGGGDGMGRLDDIATNVADKLSQDHHAGQVVVVCGTNKRMKSVLEEHAWPGDESGVLVRVLGFVPNMDEWMAASDLLVTKAGPGTIAEACARGLPVVLSSFLPGQEAGNVPYVTENGFGLYRKKPTEIALEVSKLLADRETLEQMGKNALAMGRPRASLDIARSLVSTMLPGTVEIGEASSPSLPSSSPSSSRSA